jgi:AcrR family transcriptional regulator
VGSHEPREVIHAQPAARRCVPHVFESGVHVGVNSICKAAGVSKRTLYQEFSTKDDLIAAALERCGPGFHARILPTDEMGGRARELILKVFEQVEGPGEGRGLPGLPVR